MGLYMFRILFQFISYLFCYFSRGWRRNPRESEENQPSQHAASTDSWRARNDEQRLFFL
jgi:hypothetical protein